MARAAPLTDPECPTCKVPSRLATGAEIYPHRGDLHAKSFYKCDGCGAYVGCHDGTTTALGIPADYKLRMARRMLHDQVLDPLWMEADRIGLYEPEDDAARWKIRRAARGRVYSYLADQLGIPFAKTHTAMFDIETCRRAWKALANVTYAEIREWAKARKAAA